VLTVLGESGRSEAVEVEVLDEKLFRGQTPQLEPNGDGIPNEVDDKVAVEGKYIDGNYYSLAEAPTIPEVLQVCSDQDLPAGISKATIWARVSALDEGGRVWGMVVPPDYRESQPEVEYALPDMDFPTVDLNPAGSNRYEGICENLDKVGTYAVLIYAEDMDGVSAPKVTRITVPEKEAVDPGDKLAISWVNVKEGILPRTPMLGQNYPNPFNPETWIPYQLAQNADVSVRIYSASGRLVRTLDLGYRPAGFYTGRDRAAYWDGRNQSGEQVSSGIYFYTIEAWDFSAVRKMTAKR